MGLELVGGGKVSDRSGCDDFDSGDRFNRIGALLGPSKFGIGPADGGALSVDGDCTTTLGAS